MGRGDMFICVIAKDFETMHEPATKRPLSLRERELVRWKQVISAKYPDSHILYAADQIGKVET